jgi:hypothetical protein
MEYLRNFLLIGLPATESSNAFLMPLAGHELGHSLWHSEKLGDAFEHALEKEVLHSIASSSNWAKYEEHFPGQTKDELAISLTARLSWTPCLEWALRQAEEVFCDLVGLWLFGEAYLYSFAYLLSPRRSAPRFVLYPQTRARAEILVDAASSYQVSVPSPFVDLFAEQTAPEDGRTAFLLGIADAAAAHFVPKLVDEVGSLLAGRDVRQRDSSIVAACLDDFALMVPARSAETQLTDVLNAGWVALLAPQSWADQRAVTEAGGTQNLLNELVLKSAELLEIGARRKRREAKTDAPQR